ncbi:DUF2776 domain-containing protein, partial [Escherichia coli]|nr:DUF2776 domain-containing protein [Escherichia coli]
MSQPRRISPLIRTFLIISQLTRGVNTFYNTLFPIIGYAGSIITMIWGWALLAGND